jgi:hypothetical protein
MILEEHPNPLELLKPYFLDFHKDESRNEVFIIGQIL